MTFNDFGSQSNYNRFHSTYIKDNLDISGNLILRPNSNFYTNNINSYDISGNLNINNYSNVYFNNLMNVFIKNINVYDRLNQNTNNLISISGNLYNNINTINNNYNTLNSQIITISGNLYNVYDRLNQNTNNLISISGKINDILIGNSDFSNKIIFKDEIAVSNNIIDSGSLAVAKSGLFGSNLSVGNNLYCSNKIITNDIKINDNIYYKFQMCGMLISSNLTIPLMNSIKDTTSTYTNLNLQSILSTNGNSCSIFLFPKYKIIFYNNYTVLFQLDNTSGKNILYSLITFDYALLCTNIIIKNNNNLNI